jgi:hypothetical protein
LYAGVLVNNHYVLLAAMLRFLPAADLAITVCLLWQCRGFCLTEFW